MNVDIEIDYDIFLPVYRHLLADEFFDIDFLYGGRDSGKSRHIAMQLLIDCMNGGYFRCLLIRKVANTVRDSQFALLKSLINDWGLSSLFKINETRLEIVCVANGNGFYGRGLDDVGKIKSFDNPSHAWIEEGNQITADDFVIILTSLRAAQRVKTWFSFNPECEVTYSEFWLWQEWFSHTEKLSWTWSRVVTDEQNNKFEFKVRATHSTYKNNPFCSVERRALYESYKNSKNNSYWYQTYTLGLWGYRKSGNNFLKCFDEAKYTFDIEFDKERIVHVVMDNNVVPYIAVQIWQVNMADKLIDQVDELPCEDPDNTATKAARRIAAYLHRKGYVLPVHLHGDPSANARSTTDDSGKSFFDKVKDELARNNIRYVDKVSRSAPGVAASGSFVNEIFEANYDGWKIRIGKRCRKSIEDYTMAKEAADGTILKKRITDKETKISYEKYGHFTDDIRYFITNVLPGAFIRFKARSNRQGSFAA